VKIPTFLSRWGGAWHGTEFFYASVSPQKNMVRQGGAWLGVAWHGKAWHGMAWNRILRDDYYENHRNHKKSRRGR